MAKVLVPHLKGDHRLAAHFWSLSDKSKSDECYASASTSEGSEHFSGLLRYLEDDKQANDICRTVRQEEMKRLLPRKSVLRLLRCVSTAMAAALSLNLYVASRDTSHRIATGRLRGVLLHCEDGDPGAEQLLLYQPLDWHAEQKGAYLECALVEQLGISSFMMPALTSEKVFESLH